MCECLCVFVYALPLGTLFPSAMMLDIWDYSSPILCCGHDLKCFCQVPLSLFLNQSFISPQKKKKKKKKKKKGFMMYI